MVYGDVKDLPRRAAFDKLLRDKAFNDAKNSKNGRYQTVFASVFYKFFDKKSSGANTSGGSTKSEIMPNQKLVEELHKPIIGKFEKRKVYPFFKDNIWGANLADMQLISKLNTGF